MHKNLDFLSPLELPKRFKRDLPTVRFDDGLSTWESIRGHELDEHQPPSYAYYAGIYREHVGSAWHIHDCAFDAERSQDCDGQDLWSFAQRGDHPARALGVVAYQLGWRLVPLTRWAGVKLRRPDFPHYVESHCRDWCNSADASYRALATQKLTRKNLESQIATIRLLRHDGQKLEILVLRELELYFRL